MKIEQINENQIRCILTREDLEERKIKFSELTYGSEKATRLFKDVMQQANYEYGFSVDDRPLMIEAVPMQSGMIVFVITKVTAPDEFDNHLNSIMHAMRDNLGGDLDTEDNEEDELSVGDENDGITASIRINASKPDANTPMGGISLRDLFREMFSRPTAEQPQKPNNEGVKASELRPHDHIFVFRDLGSLINAAHSLASLDLGESCLYKNTADGRYYLLLYADYLTPDGYQLLCTSMADFAENESPSTTLEAYMEEHFEIILPEHALQSLAGI